MRAIGQSDGVSVKAYAGTTGVILAFDVADGGRAGLLGFAIKRSGGNRPERWLGGGLTFPGVEHPPGVFPASNEAPIQRFRWSDYTVFPGTTYTYTVHPVHGTPAKLRLDPGPSVTVMTSSSTAGDHRVVFNRAAAASQAFAREFPEVDAELTAAKKEHRDPVLPPKALAWLSRGALEQITGFCARALDPTWALDIAIYEYELQEIRDAIDAARNRGADVRIVYHAKPKDEQTAINEANVADWTATQKRARITHDICHDKFIVLSRIDQERRTPAAVLCGSTNFTHNGVYRQANVVHTANRPELAADLPAAVRGAVRRRDARRHEEVDQRQQPAVLRRADRRGLLPAQRRGRPQAVRGRDPRRGARRLVLHGLQAQRARARGAARRAARRDPALRAAEHARQHDDRLSPRPHGRVRGDGDGSTRAWMASSRRRRPARPATSSSTRSSSSSTSRPTRRRS